LTTESLTTMTDYKQQAIDECLSTFNFDRVHKVMKELEWEWYVDGTSCLRVPTYVELVQSANQRLSSVWDKRTTVESGGLRAIYVQADMNDEGELEPPGLELQFILVSSQSY